MHWVLHMLTYGMSLKLSFPLESFRAKIKCNRVVFLRQLRGGQWEMKSSLYLKRKQCAGNQQK